MEQARGMHSGTLGEVAGGGMGTMATGTLSTASAGQDHDDDGANEDKKLQRAAHKHQDHTVALWWS